MEEGILNSFYKASITPVPKLDKDTTWKTATSEYDTKLLNKIASWGVIKDHTLW